MKPLAKDSLRLVHVEDDDEFAQFADSFLQRAGFKQPCVRFDRGAVALNYLSRIDPDRTPHAILLDLNMPGMGGLEVLRWLRRNYFKRDIAVYMLTSSDDPEDISQAEKAGITKYFFKTGLFDGLVQELDQLIASYNRKEMEQVRLTHESMAELALMSEYADDMVILSDSQGRIKWVNDPFLRASGYTLAETLGQKPGHLLRGPDSNPVAIRMLDRALRSFGSCECRSLNYRKNGTPYPVHISLGPVFTGSRFDGFLAVEQDLSEKGEPLATTAGIAA